MPRPVNERRLGGPLPARVMKPAGIPARELEEVVLGYDEAEALRLADLDGLYQEAAARSMGISRQTFGRIVEAARRKTADAILNGKALRLAGGEYRLELEGERVMKIAVPTREGMIDEHFGNCDEFTLYRVRGTEVELESSVPAPAGCGCRSGVASTLARAGVTHLVAGNMGEGAVRVLGAQGIQVIRGASGEARAAAAALAAGRLIDAGAFCAGHGGAGHDCGR